MSPTNEHAAILRGMAQFEQAESTEWIECIKKLQDPPPSETARRFIRSYTHYAEKNKRKAAALLAGAEALEAVKVAKAALQAEAWKIGNDTPTMDGNSFYRILSGDQHAVATAYKAALTRLEGK